MAIDKSKIISDIQEAGFTHLKFEFEARLNRRFDEDYCHNYIMERLAPFGLAEQRSQDFFGSHRVRSNWHPIGPMTYAEFYNDGSVDSEFTFTIETAHADKIQHVFDAWNALVEHNGNGCEVSGAGMHISVLTSGTYPINSRLPAAKIRNFKEEVTKLLPALYIGATSGNFTRGLRFRNPVIASNDQHTGYDRGKYSAIYTHGDTCMEYRLFETCYERPETYWEYLGVIARTLEYYSNPRQKVAKLNQVFEVYGGSNHLEGWIGFSKQIQIIKKQFTYIKPAGMTATEFFKNRGIVMTVKDAKAKEKTMADKLKVLYAEHKSAHEKVRQEPLNEYQQDNMDYWKSVEPGHPEAWYWSRVTGRQEKIETEAEYIKNNLKRGNAIVKMAC